MALYDVSGTADGSGTVNSQPAVDHLIVDPFGGSSALATPTQNVVNVSGMVVGSGGVHDELLMNVEGVAAGAGTFTGEAFVIHAVSGYIVAGSALGLSVPEPFVGVGNVTGYMEVVCVWPPLCQTRCPESFRWGHVFGPDDLMVCITGSVIPVCVTYTLYQVLQPGCQRKQVGPAHRKAVPAGNGCYYATGTAGDCGQPGLWAICWSYQRTFGEPAVEKCCYFTVLDSVLSPIPGDSLPRECKYGWD